MRSRGYSEKGFRTLKPLAFASGALLIRGYERGERVYNSMISRGFKGTLELKEREFKSSKLILLVSIFSIAVSTLDWFIT
jgi:cobalt/nickel transport system permease protein